MLTGHTRVAGVMGTPIRHSLSPAIFNAAFGAAGLDWAYLAFEVPEGAAGLAMAGVRSLGIDGMSVTMPHKAAVLDALDRVSEDAAALGAVNCITRRGGLLHGDNTDGPGFVDALRIDEGLEVTGARCAVVGAGGAGRAVARALAQAGAASVTVVNRSAAPAELAVAVSGPSGRLGTHDDLEDAEIVVNATPLGMGILVTTTGDHEPLPFDVSRLDAGQVVVDLVYHPEETALLAAARRRDAVAISGLGMLVHQAAHAFRRWTGDDPPLDAMAAATRRELARRALFDGRP
jgi:shikimate dehydrogenase